MGIYPPPAPGPPSPYPPGETGLFASRDAVLCRVFRRLKNTVKALYWARAREMVHEVLSNSIQTERLPVSDWIQKMPGRVWRGHQLLYGQTLSWSLFTLCTQGHALGGSSDSEKTCINSKQQTKTNVRGIFWYTANSPLLLNKSC